MSQPALDVLGIGNAIIDVLGQADDAFLTRHGIAKGAMTLIDEYRAHQLSAAMEAPVMVSGGSAANTCVGVAALGARAGFIGKVKDDALGQAFAEDIRRAGVAFATPMAKDGPATASSHIIVTPDAQRSMNTYLGACRELGPRDVDPAEAASAAVLYLEGYLWDPLHAKEAIRKAVKAAKDAGRQVALSLSDPFCVGRWRDEFRALIEGPVDIVFANEDEAKSLFEQDDFDDVLQAFAGLPVLAAITRSAKGAVVTLGGEVHVIDAVPPKALVDTTGAGDLFAAGFLTGLVRGLGLADCGRLGSVCASEIIAVHGARPQTNLRAAAAVRGLA